MIRMFTKMIRMRRQLFTEAKDEIAAKNVRALKHVSCMATILVVLFIVITPFLVPTWEIKLQYILLPPTTAIFYIIGVIYGRKKKHSYLLSQILVVLLCLTVLGFVIAIDVFAYPDYTATYMPIVILVMPVLFVIPFWIMYPLITVTEIIYVIMILAFKDTNVQTSDIFTSVVALFFAYLVDGIIMQMNVENLFEKLRFKEMSSIDQLTGIYNKKSCERNIINFLDMREDEEEFGILIVDLDNFKHINDSYGHQIGDRVLSGVGQILQNVFHADDIVGRIGGDEFMVLIRNRESIDNINDKYIQIKESIRTLLSEHGDEEVTVSIGAALLKEKTYEFSEIYNKADNALYKAKGSGKNQFCIV